MEMEMEWNGNGNGNGIAFRGFFGTYCRKSCSLFFRILPQMYMTAYTSCMRRVA